MFNKESEFAGALSNLSSALFDDFVANEDVKKALLGEGELAMYELGMSEPEIVEVFNDTYPWLNLSPTSAWVADVKRWVAEQRKELVLVEGDDDKAFAFFCQHPSVQAFFDQRSASEDATLEETVDLLVEIEPSIETTGELVARCLAYLSQPIDYTVKLYKDQHQYETGKPEFVMDGYAFEKDAIAEVKFQMDTDAFYAANYESGCFDSVDTIYREENHE
jgi:hypothetical protein